MRRTAVVLGANLLLGVGGLAWLLADWGTEAAALLLRGPSTTRLAAFATMVALGLVVDALRWWILLGSLGRVPGLARLTAFRAAGQSLSALIPSAKLGGEPLRVYLLVQERIGGGPAIASVAVDRTLELGVNVAFACLFALILLRHGIPELAGAAATVALGATALALGVLVTVRRLRRGAGVVTAFVRLTGLDRLRAVRGQLGVLAEAEAATARLLDEPRRLGRAAAAGIASTAVVLVEYHLLLTAFGLPATPVAVVAAVFTTGAAHALPVPAAIGALEGAMMWLFGLLGYPADVGLAVGLAARVREIAWVLPGLAYLAARGVGAGVYPASARPSRSRAT